MDHKEAGQGTPFDGMSHENMLAWLDKANSGAVQGASDRLVSAAKEIRKIAEELKVRPQMVEWKGEGADAFRTWSADLANATLRLGAYSEGASKWLAQASDAIASAQAAIPRTQAGAQANLEAARAARNDPDASAVAQKSAETLITNQESNRQEAVAQMRRLAQSYSFSASQMDGLEKPAFPPPPGAIVPEDTRRSDDAERQLAGPGATGFGGSTDGSGDGGSYRERQGGIAGTQNNAHAVSAHGAGTAPRAVEMGIDGVTALPQASGTSSLPLTGPVNVVKPDGNSLLPAGPFTFGVGDGRAALPGQTGPGRGTAAVRGPGVPGPAGAGTASVPPRLPRDGGITGGRPVPPNSGRPTGGIPRGTVIGGEGMHGRGGMGHGTGIGGATGGAGQAGTVGGRRLAGETGGLVGGRPQQQGRISARPFTLGGSGLVRGTAPTEGGRGRGGASGGLGSRMGERRRDERGERPEYLVEDEETWQQGGRRVVPPVID